MRKVIVAAATAATLGTLGLAATAQAQPTSHSAGRADPAVSKTVVAGIPAAFEVVDSASSKCTWTVTGLPGPVTAGAGGTNNCTDLIDGVFPTAGTVHITAKATAGGTTTTFTITVTVKASPGENDATGVGSDTITPLTDALSGGYNGTVAASAPHEYSWDAVNPITGAIGDSIAEKADCPSIPRPDGSSAGINQLATFTTSSSGPYCTNFARSSRPRGSSDPAFGPGGVAFVNLAGDAVTWSHQKTSNAPAHPDPDAAQPDLHLLGHQLEPGRRQERHHRAVPAPVRLGHAVVLAGRDRRHHARPVCQRQQQRAGGERGRQPRAQHSRRDLPLLRR